MAQNLANQSIQKPKLQQTFAHNASQFQKFIQSNGQYLLTKFDHYFNKKNQTIGSFSQEAGLLFVNQIFSLQSYNHSAQIKKVIQNGLKSNIQQFRFQKISEQKKQASFEYQSAVELLTYIIQNNSMFAVQYDSNQNNQNDSNPSSNLKIQLNLNEIEQVNESSKMGNQSNLFKNQNAYSDMIYQKNKLKNSFIQNQNQFDVTQETNKNKNQNLVKRNAKIIFLFYCRQQMQLPNLSTFDYIKNQTQSMSLGKCLTFAKATQLLNVFITKDVFLSKFKKLAQGKKNINFEKFYILLSHLQVLDPEVNNRLGLYSQDTHKFLKYVKLPFNTKDTSPRQVIAYRNFSNRLTEHSGQTSENLKEQIQNHKIMLKNIQKINNLKNAVQVKNRETELISPKDLSNNYYKNKKRSCGKDYTVDLSFISSIVHPQDTDKTWLKEHQIESLAKKHNSQFKQKRLQTERYKSVDKLTIRKQYIVDDIRKRIKQIQSTQRIDYNKLRSKLKLPQNNLQSKSKQKHQASIMSQNLRYQISNC